MEWSLHARCFFGNRPWFRAFLRLMPLLALLCTDSWAQSPAPELHALWEQIYNEPDAVLSQVQDKLAAEKDLSTERAAILYAIGAEAASFAEKSEAQKEFAEKALAVAAHRFLWPWVHAVSTLGSYWEFDGKKTQAQTYYQEAIKLAEDAQNKELIAYANNNMAYFYAHSGKVKDAIERITVAMHALDKEPREVLYHDVLNNLAIVYTGNELVGRVDEGRKLLQEALNYFKSRHMRYMTGNTYINLGLFYKKRREYETAIETFREAIAASRAEQKQELLPYYLMHLAAAYNLSQRYEEALVASQEASHWFREFKNNSVLADNLYTSSVALVHLNRPREALEALQERERLLSVDSSFTESDEALDVAIRAWRQLGDTNQELETWRRWGKAFRQTFDQKNAQFTQQMVGLLELERKEADNKLLDERLNQADRMGRILKGLLGLTVLLLGFMLQAVRQSRMIRLQRNRMQEVLHNIEEGILRFGRDLKVEPEFSTHLTQILDLKNDAAGQDILNLLFENSDCGTDAQATIRAALLNILGEDELAWTLNSAQLPLELRRQGRILNLLWQPHLSAQRQVDKMLLVIRDVTSSKALEAAVQASRQESEIITHYLQEMLQANARSLAHLMQDLTARRAHLETALQQPEEKIQALRELHTLKGNARGLGLKALAEAVHELESAAADPTRLDEAWRTFTGVSQHYEKIHQDMFRGPSKAAASLLALVDEVTPALREQLARGQVPLGSLTVRDEIGLWPEALQEPLRTVLLHGLSNAVDHGYVRPGRTDAAVFEVAAQLHAAGLTLTIRDRGQGIAWDQLKSLSRARGFAPGPGRPLTDLLFADGVSTSETLSLSSGRGVGLAAVHEACRRMGAEVTLLDNQDGPGTQLVVTIPAAAMHLSA